MILLYAFQRFRDVGSNRQKGGVFEVEGGIGDDIDTYNIIDDI